MQKDLSLPNLNYEDFTFTLDKEAIKDEIDKVVIEAKPDSVRQPSTLFKQYQAYYPNNIQAFW